MVTAAMKSRHLFLGRKAEKARQHIKKQRHRFADKVPYSQSYGFSMYGCESWTIKKAEHQRSDAFKLERTLESSLDCQEIKPVNLKGNQP